MSEQLSKIYRLALASQRGGAAPDVELLLALDDSRDDTARAEMLDRLAATPDAAALVAFARASDRESRLLALELRRVDAIAKSWARPHRRRVLAAVAAVAALALAIPLALRDGTSDRAPDRQIAAPLEVDRNVILAASFENGGRDIDTRQPGNGNATIFSSRFDG